MYLGYVVVMVEDLSKSLVEFEFSDALKTSIDNIIVKKEEMGTARLFSKGGTNPVKSHLRTRKVLISTFLILK